MTTLTTRLNTYSPAALTAFGAGIAMKPAMTGDQRNGGAEEEALEHADEHVVVADELLRVLPVVMAVDTQEMDAVNACPDHAHEIGHDRQRRNQHQAAEKTRHDEIPNGVGPHARQGIDLLGDAHRSELSRHGRTGSSSYHYGCKDRSYLPCERHRNRRTHHALHVEKSIHFAGLKGKNRPRKK